MRDTPWAGDTPPFAGQYGNGRPGLSPTPDRDAAPASAAPRRRVNLERAHRTVLPPREAPVGAPRSGSA